MELRQGMRKGKKIAINFSVKSFSSLTMQCKKWEWNSGLNLSHNHNRVSHSKFVPLLKTLLCKVYFLSTNHVDMSFAVGNNQN